MNENHKDKWRNREPKKVFICKSRKNKRNRKDRDGVIEK